jgi:hypothetical protein
MIKNHDLFMLTKEEIEILSDSHANSYDSYEDFAFHNNFRNKTADRAEHKYNARFDSYFFKLDSMYNKLTGQAYIVSQQMNEFRKIHSVIDFNDYKSVQDFLFKTNSMKDIVRTLNRLKPANIIEDLSVNFNGWAAIAEEQGVDISQQLNKIETLCTALRAEDIISPILSKLEKAQRLLSDVNYDNRLVTLSNPTDLEKSTYMESCFNLKRHVAFFEKYFNQENVLNTLIKDSKVFEYIDQYKTIRKEIVDTLIKNKPDFSYSCAHKFVTLFNNAGAVELMLLERSNTDLDSVHRIRNTIKIDDKNSQVSQINLFDDNSIAIKKSSGDWVNLNSKELKDSFIENFMYKELFNKLKKSPTIAKMFVTKLKEDFDECIHSFVAANTYLEYEAILKSKDYNLLEEIDDSLFESLDDSMNAYVRKHKIEQYGLSISSKKYQHLYDEDVFKTLELLYDLKIPASELQESLGKKLASFKTSEDFNKGLKQLYSIHSGFNTEAIIKKANAINAEVIKNDNNLIILKIENFQQSSAVGSTSWCIVRDEVHFKSYKEDCQQYFIYDLNKDPADNHSLIGITLYKDGSHSAAHLKNDNQLYNDENEFKTLQLEIIKHDLKSYPALNEELKSKIDANTDSKKQSLLKNITSKLFNR